MFPFNRAKRRKPKKAVNWKTNLAAIWLAQFLSLSAFSFSLPFLPLYLRKASIVPEADVSFWSSCFISAAALSMMVMSPIWGSLGDKYGRKMMLVRANLGGAFALYLMGVVENIEALIVLRLLQGAFTGTVPAAQTLVTTNTPEKNQSFAIGLIMAAVNAGNMAGNFFGGMCASVWGPAASFKISGGLLLVSTILVTVFVREDFTPPDPALLARRSARMRNRKKRYNAVMYVVPLLVLITYVSFIQTYDEPFFSLFVDDLHSHANPAAIVDVDGHGRVYAISGIISAVASIAAMAGSILTGIWMDKKMPSWAWVLVSAAAGVGGVWMGFSAGLWEFGASRAIFAATVNAVASSLVVILGKNTPMENRGEVFGWSVTVRSLGWILAPLTGGLAASVLSWPWSFGVEGAMCFIMAPAFIWLYRRYPPGRRRGGGEAEASIRIVGEDKMAAPHTTPQIGGS